VKKIYKAVFPVSFRLFIWRRIHDIRFLSSIPFNLNRKIFKTYKYKDHVSFDENSIKEFDSNIEFSNIKDLKSSFVSLNIPFKEGEFALYLSSKNGIEKIILGLSARYPHRIGLKLIKSQTLHSDGTPFYCGIDASKTSTKSIMTAVGSVYEKKIISNILSEHGVAPKTYDLIKLKSGNDIIFGMVVEHIDGEVVLGQKGSEFMERFFNILKAEGIQQLGGKSSGDFSAPNFGKNIIKNNSDFYYVDIQNFNLLIDNKSTIKLASNISNITHFGASNLIRSDRYSYQSVPGMDIKGKRDSEYRLHVINELLSRHNITLKNSHVLDVGCNLGLFVKYALICNAGWAVGLDMPDVAKTARSYMYRSGFTKFDILGVDLKSSSIFDQLPYKSYDFIFYMSIEGHIGFPEWLSKLSFEYFLYEGHEGESIKDITNKINFSKLKVRILEDLKSRDGDSLSRPILLCRRL
jgi:hypothetical protein